MLGVSSSSFAAAAASAAATTTTSTHHLLCGTLHSASFLSTTHPFPTTSVFFFFFFFSLSCFSVMLLLFLLLFISFYIWFWFCCCSMLLIFKWVCSVAVIFTALQVCSHQSHGWDWYYISVKICFFFCSRYFSFVFYLGVLLDCFFYPKG